MAKTIQQLKAEIKDLGERLYYCSNTKEGRKVRRKIEMLIKLRERDLNLRINQCAGCISEECETCEI